MCLSAIGLSVAYSASCCGGSTGKWIGLSTHCARSGLGRLDSLGVAARGAQLSDQFVELCRAEAERMLSVPHLVSYLVGHRVGLFALSHIQDPAAHQQLVVAVDGGPGGFGNPGRRADRRSAAFLRPWHERSAAGWGAEQLQRIHAQTFS